MAKHPAKSAYAILPIAGRRRRATIGHSLCTNGTMVAGLIKALLRLRLSARLAVAIPLLALAACAAGPDNDVLDDYTEVASTGILSAPDARPSRFDPASRDTVFRGKYLVELLGCAACHTDGALVGDPNPDLSLAGSRIGIAYSNPLGDARPGIVFPSNLTPDTETGIGSWTDAQIAAAIRTGQGRHGRRRIAVMPWQGYAKLSQEDAMAMVAYLRSIPAISHQVPSEVEPGTRSPSRFVYFGVYERR